MKNLLFSLLFVVSSLSAVSLRELLDNALSHTPSLEIITARLAANKQNIKIANQFENPEIFLSKNTLDSSQAMSQTLLTLKQKIPYYNKRVKREAVAISQENLLKEKLHAAKVKLVQRIKNEAYLIWELREKEKIINSYIELTKQNIALYESYTSVSDNEHMGIMKAELSFSDLQVQKTLLKAKIATAYARISYLSAMQVKNLTIELKIKKKPNLQTFQKSLLLINPDILIQKRAISKQTAKVALANSNNYPDIALLAGYATREKFDNYFNFGIGLSLPIYGTEDAKEEREKALLLAKQSQKSDTELAIGSQLELYYAQMLASYKIYHIIEDEALPQVAHMFELSSSAISVGGDLFKYIDVLFAKLDLEMKSIQAVANYKRAEAQISQLQGALK